MKCATKGDNAGQEDDYKQRWLIDCWEIFYSSLLQTFFEEAARDREIEILILLCLSCSVSLFWLRCPDCPILVCLSCSVPAVCPDCPVLFWLACPSFNPGCPVSRNCPVLLSFAVHDLIGRPGYWPEHALVQEKKFHRPEEPFFNFLTQKTDFIQISGKRIFWNSIDIFSQLKNYTKHYKL